MKNLFATVLLSALAVTLEAANPAFQSFDTSQFNATPAAPGYVGIKSGAAETNTALQGTPTINGVPVGSSATTSTNQFIASQSGTGTNVTVNGITAPSSGGAGSEAYGAGASASGASTTAVGNSATASSTGASAFGFGANAGGQFSTAWGDAAYASGNNDVALGFKATTTNDAIGTAIGASAFNSGVGGGAIGTAATNKFTQSWAIGNSSLTTSNTQIMLGNTSQTVIIPNILVGLGTVNEMPNQTTPDTNAVLTAKTGAAIFAPVSVAGTVTSINAAGDGTVIGSFTGGPVTTSGTLTAVLANANANTVLAGPSSGSAAEPTFQTSPTFNGANISNIPSSSLTGLTTNGLILVNTNYVTNTIYTNLTGSAIVVNEGVALQTAAVAGSAVMQLVVPGSVTNAVGQGTTLLSIAMPYTNQISAIVSNNGTWYFNAVVNGAGDSATLLNGTGQYVYSSLLAAATSGSFVTLSAGTLTVTNGPVYVTNAITSATRLTNSFTFTPSQIAVYLQCTNNDAASGFTVGQTVTKEDVNSASAQIAAEQSGQTSSLQAVVSGTNEILSAVGGFNSANFYFMRLGSTVAFVNATSMSNFVIVTKAIRSGY